jgi:hypothetical protein
VADIVDSSFPKDEVPRNGVNPPAPSLGTAPFSGNQACAKPIFPMARHNGDRGFLSCIINRDSFASYFMMDGFHLRIRGSLGGGRRILTLLRIIELPRARRWGSRA